ncbi:unnamed protein product [Spirodela intermedia]|uniref:Uncharacterized protein n=1 Tax=Spirodela intermedia TaxID=51605 RepID=A0A7I8KP31_SPIIN|nr:unnamed protein product [Spirodela intermedia]
MGVWKDKLDFLVLWMENFDVILGADFAVKAKPRIFFNYNSLLLCMKPHKRLDGGGACVKELHPQEFHDIIPTKLPTILLSSWDIKHAIELLAREHPLARAPYKMSDKSSLS